MAGRSKFDMAVFTWDSEDGLTHNWVYNSNLFEPATIARMAQLFHCALEHAVRDPQIKLSELLDRLHEADRERRSAEETKLRESSVSRLRRADRRNL